MASLMRAWIALVAVAAPLVPRAQQDPGAHTEPGFAWLWLLAGAAIVVALLWLAFAGRRGRTAPPRRP